MELPTAFLNGSVTKPGDRQRDALTDIACAMRFR